MKRRRQIRKKKKRINKKRVLLLSIVMALIVTFIGIGSLNVIKNIQMEKQKQEQEQARIKEEKEEEERRLKYYSRLVNRTNPVDSNYKPETIVKPNIVFLDNALDEEMHMDGTAAKAIEELFMVAKEEGINLIATSAYRSYESQEKVYISNVNSRGQEEADKYAAKPGQSEHQTGLCIDVTNEERWFDKSTKEAIWLANNSHRFGFILRYPEGKEEITGYNYEPWHVRYVGKEIAEEIFRDGITLEEYTEKKQ